MLLFSICLKSGHIEIVTNTPVNVRKAYNAGPDKNQMTIHDIILALLQT